MPVYRLYRHGMTAGTPPASNDHLRGLRGDVQGWTDRSTRSNSRFLYSVDEREISEVGFALSLTVKDCPPTPADWHRCRRNLIDRLRRMGMVRMHWLTEWQRRGVPHLHAAVWFDHPAGSPWPRLYINEIRHAWLLVAEPYGAGRWSQHIAPIDNAVGWFQYLSKHAVRGLHHYQRSAANIPAKWKGKTGRMWGKLGDWPTVDAIRVELDRPGHFRFRRIVRAWRLADARRAGDVRRMKSARRMLQANRRELSEVRGLSEWMPMGLTLTVLDYLAREGHQVRC